MSAPDLLAGYEIEFKASLGGLCHCCYKVIVGKNSELLVLKLSECRHKPTCI